MTDSFLFSFSWMSETMDNNTILLYIVIKIRNFLHRFMFSMLGTFGIILKAVETFGGG